MNQKRGKRARRRSGFTLMEVLLVLAILVILGSMVTVYFANVQGNANRNAAKAQVDLLEDALELYRLDVGTYPSSQDGLSALYQVPSNIANPAKWGGPYLKEQVPADPWGNAYQYSYEGGEMIRLWSLGPDGQDGSGDDISNYQ